MKGIVFTEFMEMVEKEFGIQMVDSITRHQDLETGGAYTAVGNYSHHELLCMVGQLSAKTSLSHEDLVFVFGKYLFNSFVKHYPQFFEGEFKVLNWLEGIEEVIHSEVRKLYPEACPPRFRCERRSVDELVMFYESDKPFSKLAEGLILGCIEYSKQDFELVYEPEEGSEGKRATFGVRKKQP